MRKKIFANVVSAVKRLHNSKAMDCFVTTLLAMTKFFCGNFDKISRRKTQNRLIRLDSVRISQQQRFSTALFQTKTPRKS